MVVSMVGLTERIQVDSKAGMLAAHSVATMVEWKAVMTVVSMVASLVV